MQAGLGGCASRLVAGLCGERKELATQSPTSRITLVLGPVFWLLTRSSHYRDESDDAKHLVYTGLAAAFRAVVLGLPRSPAHNLYVQVDNEPDLVGPRWAYASIATHPTSATSGSAASPARPGPTSRRRLSMQQCCGTWWRPCTRWATHASRCPWAPFPLVAMCSVAAAASRAAPKTSEMPAPTMSIYFYLFINATHLPSLSLI